MMLQLVLRQSLAAHISFIFGSLLLLLLRIFFLYFAGLLCCFSFCLQQVLGWMVRHAEQRDKNCKEQDVCQVESVLFVRERKEVFHSSCKDAHLFRLRNHDHSIKLSKDKQTSAGNEEQKYREDHAIQESGWCN